MSQLNASLANFVTDEDLKVGKVFPPLSSIRDVSRNVAVEVIKQAMEEGQARRLVGKEIPDLEALESYIIIVR